MNLYALTRDQLTTAELRKVNAHLRKLEMVGVKVIKLDVPFSALELDSAAGKALRLLWDRKVKPSLALRNGHVTVKVIGDTDAHEVHVSPDMLSSCTCPFGSERKESRCSHVEAAHMAVGKE